MKKNILVRILAALGGLSLWVLGLCALAETFFHVPVTGKLGQLLGAGTPVAVLITLLLVIGFCVFGTCCLLMLSTRRAAKRSGFVMQKGENGMIGVSVKSIEGLVQTCVKQHEVIAGAEVEVVDRRDGILILLSIQEAAGVNIPVAVGALQKQIKQYVNTCTGVDVQEVRVLVENTEENVVESPYAVKEPVAMAAVTVALQSESAAVEATADAPVEIITEQEAPAVETEQAEVITEADAIPEIAEASAAQEMAAPVPVVPVAPIIPEMPEIIEEEDDRPLHQRLFGTEEQPVFVPAPPELIIEPSEEIADLEEAEAEIVEAAPVTDAADEDTLGANAVLEVVEAIADEEPFALAEEIASAQELEIVTEDVQDVIEAVEEIADDDERIHE